jgi:crossover junction endonuclease MUS81
MKTLVQKELVYERGRPLRKYALTDEGWEVAERIKDTREWREQNGEEAQESGQQAQSHSRQGSAYPDPAGTQTAPPHLNTVPDGVAVNDSATLPSFRPIQLPPGSFTVRLLLDVREVRAKTDRDYMQNELAKLGVTPLMRSLEVGDAQWVAKCNDPDFLRQHGAEGDEVVLDWIVERKRLDDLIGSIKDGRFHEQKFRLKRSGVKEVIYIIEEIALDPGLAQKYEESVISAMASTQVVNDYFVKRTTKMDETIKYMARLTNMLKRTYEGKTLNIIPTNVLTAQNYLPLLERARAQDPDNGLYITYQAFSSIASKSEMMTLRDVFLKMLMTTKGVTGERALEIQKRWKTPYAFVKAFEECGGGTEGKKRKHELVCGQMGQLFGRKKIQKALSQKIAEVWGDA